jgi:uncharacterized protein YkwD
MNWVDICFFIFIAYHIYRGWQTGFVYQIIGLISYILSFYTALYLEGPVGTFIGSRIGLVGYWRPIVGFFIVALLSDWMIAEILTVLSHYLPKKIFQSKLHAFFGMVVALIIGSLFGVILLLVVLSVPLRGTLQRDIKQSNIGSFVLSMSEQYAPWIRKKIQDEVTKTQKFLTITPGEVDRVELDIPPVTSLLPDPISEQTMLNMVNNERNNEHIKPLTLDPNLVEIARNHSKDMFINRYFSHKDSQNKYVSDRANEAGIPYIIIGENIAYAGDIETAHTGLMNSLPHKANILDPRFTRIGIGIINSDYFGFMISQVFAD